MEQNLKRVYEEAHEVKSILDQELRQYEQNKGKLSSMRRQNLVLWKHIKKLIKRQRQAKVREKRRKQQVKELMKAQAKLSQSKGIEQSHQTQALIDDIDSQASDDEPNKSDEEDEAKFRKLEEELDQLANDPDLFTDLMKLKRQTENKEIDV